MTEPIGAGTGARSHRGVPQIRRVRRVAVPPIMRLCGMVAFGVVAWLCLLLLVWLGVRWAGGA